MYMYTKSQNENAYKTGFKITTPFLLHFLIHVDALMLCLSNRF